MNTKDGNENMPAENPASKGVAREGPKKGKGNPLAVGGKGNLVRIPRAATGQEVQAVLEDHVRDALATLLRGLRATVTWANKSGRVSSRPDFHERRQAASLILAYVIGEPVKRAINANVKDGHMDLAELEAKAKGSPALQEAMRRIVGSSGGVVEIEAREAEEEEDELSRLRVPGEGPQQTGGGSGAVPSEERGSK